MKTNLLISRLRNRPGTQASTGDAGVSPAVKCPGTQASSPAKTRLRWLFFFLLSLIAVLISLVACKSPATLTNDTKHHTRDSNYHSSIQRIETHDTIVLGLPLHYHKKYCRDSNGKAVLEPFAGGNLLPDYLPLIRVSDRKITIRDTVFVARTDTLLRTQTITQKERYIPPFYRFCTISFVTFVSFVTLAFSIHLLLRYLKIRSPT